MRLVLGLALAAAAASAQTAEDARPLLESIADAVRAAGSVRVEGVSTEETPHRETHFELLTQGPLLMRYQAVIGTDRLLQVCDGTSRWLYLEGRKSYNRATEEEGLCYPPVARWSGLTEHLANARIVSHQDCDTIEATYTTGEVRTLCVDRARRVILRERIQNPPNETTITYSRVEYNPPQPGDAFQFTPPSDSSAGGRVVPFSGEGGNGDYGSWRTTGGTPYPIMISRTEPQYSPEALKARLQGSVVVSLVIDERGIPQDIKVVRGLGMGLDEKAIEAVGSWRFRPARSEGFPVAMPAKVEVAFRLP